MMRGKRSLDDAEISLQRVRARIGFSGRDGMARDFAAVSASRVAASLA